MATIADREKAIELVRKFEVLTKQQLEVFFHITKGFEKNETISMLKYLEKRHELFSDENTIRYFPNAVLDPKTIEAFWVFTAVAKNAERTIFKPAYPSSVGFVTDRVYLVTVCEHATADNELIALKHKDPDRDVTHIIACANVKAEEVRKDLLPTGPFAFAEMQFRDILTEVPKIRFIKAKGDNDAELDGCI